METSTAVLLLQLIIGLVALAGSGIGFMNMRANGLIKVQLAEIETRRIAEKGDVDNTANLINVIQSVVLGLKPSTDALTDASRTMENTSTVMASLVNITGEVLSKQTNTQDFLASAIQNMTDKAGERDRQMTALPGKVKDEMSADLEKIPRAVEEALAPKIETIKTDIAAVIQALDEKLTERIEAATDKIPNRTTELVSAEFVAMRKTIDSLKDMLKTAQGIQIPEDVEAGEGAPVVEEKTEEPKEG